MICIFYSLKTIKTSGISEALGVILLSSGGMGLREAVGFGPQPAAQIHGQSLTSQYAIFCVV